MFLLNGNPLPQGIPFKDAEGNQYPANWLNLSTAEEKAAIGITEVADPVIGNDKIYWDGDTNAPKDLDQVKTMLIGENKALAGELLAQTDWKIIRAAEGVKSVDQETLDFRAAIRAASNDNEAAINACTSVDELAAIKLSFPQKNKL